MVGAHFFKEEINIQVGLARADYLQSVEGEVSLGQWLWRLN